MNVLVLGATGMLGNTVFRVLAETNGIQVFGSVRQIEAQHFFTTELASQLVVVENLEKYDQLERLLDAVQPQVVVNCISLEKSASQDLEKSLSIFSLLPQRLGHLCRLRDARLIQISSDGVFSGSRGK